jgi:acyl transferase domain-containing protein
MRKKSFNRAGNDIAITGIALRLPGTTSLDELWRHLVEQRCFITDFPASRLSPTEVQEYTAKYQLKNKLAGSFLADIDTFDAPFFSITRREAELMDPHQRMALELSWQALEDAAYRPSTLAGKNVGVYMGICNGDYLGLIEANHTDRDPYIPTGTGYSIVANRVSYFFDFRGPSVVNDAACASSLVSLHQAVQALRHENVSVALAGAVNICSSANRFIEFSQSGMLSKSGRCKAFDIEADGYVRGEGGVVVVLKPLAQALADNDRIHGVIKGTAINHGGKTGSLTITNPDAQSDVITSALLDANVEANSVTYIEAHGPGTPLGDPIEISGIENAYFKNLKNNFGKNSSGKIDPDKNQWRCGIGSVKTNFGHLEAAAGLLGLVKVITAMQHKTLPASANFTQLNPIIEIDNTPLFVVADNCPWDAPDMSGIIHCPRRAGVSSFGMGGVNTHIIVEEFDNADQGIVSQNNNKSTTFIDKLNIVPLSAKTQHQLQAQANNLLRYLQTNKISNAELHRLAYTLQTGRETFAHRLAFWIDTADKLIEQLKLFNAGSPTDPKSRFVQGLADDSAAILSPLQSPLSGEYSEVEVQRALKQWVGGSHIDWHDFYNDSDKPRPLSLPTYPFDKQRYWLTTDTTHDSALDSAIKQTSVIHPLVHRNTSTFHYQNYTSTFSGDEFFLNDHRVHGKKILPGVAYLEMARAAVADATAVNVNTTAMEIRNVVWPRPFLVSEPRQIDIRLMPVDDSNIDFEVYSQENKSELVHCQGKVLLVAKRRAAGIDHKRQFTSTRESKLSAQTLYAAFAKMGIQYGAAHRGVIDLYQNNSEVLARLRLPKTVASTAPLYLLHPSLLDSALQANIGLTVDSENIPAQSPLPFALESIAIFSPCSAEMTARLCHSTEFSSTQQAAGSATVKLDVDLYDQNGNACAQMRGFSLRMLKQTFSEPAVGKNILAPALDSATTAGTEARDNEHFNEAFYRQVIARIVNQELTAAQAVELE